MRLVWSWFGLGFAMQGVWKKLAGIDSIEEGNQGRDACNEFKRFRKEVGILKSGRNMHTDASSDLLRKRGRSFYKPAMEQIHVGYIS